jgi:hypothetical protein
MYDGHIYINVGLVVCGGNIDFRQSLVGMVSTWRLNYNRLFSC